MDMSASAADSISQVQASSASLLVARSASKTPSAGKPICVSICTACAHPPPSISRREPERARGGTGGARTSWSATKDSSPGVSPPAGLSRTAACCSSHSIASSVCNSARQVRETTSPRQSNDCRT